MARHLHDIGDEAKGSGVDARTMTGSEFPLLIREILRHPLRTHAREHIVCGARRHDYPTLHDRVCRLAGALAGLGVRRGDTVAVMDWDSHRYLEAFFAVPMLGAVLFTVNVRLAPQQIAYTLAHAQTRVLVAHADFAPLLAGMPDALLGVTLIEARDDEACGYEALLAQGAPMHAFPDLDEAAPATLFYTTGTTGAPKGVSFTHRQIVLHTLAASVALRVAPDDVYMPMTPMFHVHAWGFPYVATLAGLRQVYAGRYTPQTLLSLRQSEGVTLSHCVPTILRMLLDCPQAATTDLTGWRVIVGGSALPQALCRQALARGMDVIGGYGMSETCPLLTLAQARPGARGDPAQDAAVRTRAGLPLPLVDVRIQDGEVVARAPWLTQGYRGDPDASAALWDGGVLHTGDVGEIDEHGALAITDRLRDVIKTGGEWVSSLAVEDIVAAHPAVAEVAVIGVQDALWGERPAALVVLRSGAAVTAAEVQALVAERAASGEVSRYAVPAHVRIVAALPKTSVGKPDKRAMRAAFAAAHGGAVTA